MRASRISKIQASHKPCTPVVHIKIAGKWMFIPLKMVLIGIDPYPCNYPILSSFIVELFVLGELSF
jgi:hypothetical protein